MLSPAPSSVTEIITETKTELTCQTGVNKPSAIFASRRILSPGYLTHIGKLTDQVGKTSVAFKGNDLQTAKAFYGVKTGTGKPCTIKFVNEDKKEYYLCAESEGVFLRGPLDKEPNDDKFLFNILPVPKTEHKWHNIKNGDMFLSCDDEGNTTMKKIEGKEKEKEKEKETTEKRQAWFRFVD